MNNVAIDFVKKLDQIPDFQATQLANYFDQILKLLLKETDHFTFSSNGFDEDFEELFDLWSKFIVRYSIESSKIEKLVEKLQNRASMEKVEINQLFLVFGLILCGELKIMQKDYELGLHYFQKAEELWSESWQYFPFFQIFSRKGYIQMMLNNLDDAFKCFTLELEHLSSIVSDEGSLHSIKMKRAAHTFFYLALAQRRKGEYRAAIESYQKALEIAKSENLKTIEIGTLNNLAIVNKIIGEYSIAKSHLEDLLNIVEDDITKARIHINLGTIKETEGLLEEACQDYDIAAEIYREKNMKIAYAFTIANKGSLFVQMDKLNKAKAFFQVSIKIAETHKEYVATIETYFALFKLAHMSGSIEEMANYVEKMNSISLGMDEGLKTKITIANLLYDLKKNPTNHMAHQRLKELHERVVEDELKEMLTFILIDLYLKQEDRAKAIIKVSNLLAHLEETAEKSYLFPTMIKIKLVQSRLLVMEKRLQEAKNRLEMAQDLARTFGLRLLERSVVQEVDKFFMMQMDWKNQDVMDLLWKETTNLVKGFLYNTLMQEKEKLTFHYFDDKGLTTLCGRNKEELDKFQSKYGISGITLSKKCTKCRRLFIEANLIRAIEYVGTSLNCIACGKKTDSIQIKEALLSHTSKSSTGKYNRLLKLRSKLLRGRLTWKCNNIGCPSKQEFSIDLEQLLIV